MYDYSSGGPAYIHDCLLAVVLKVFLLHCPGWRGTHNNKQQQIYFSRGAICCCCVYVVGVLLRGRYRVDDSLSGNPFRVVRVTEATKKMYVTSLLSSRAFETKRLVFLKN